MEEYTNAINSFKLAIHLNPNLEDFHYDIGRAFQRQAQISNRDENISKANQSFNIAIKLNPNVADYYLAKCELLFVKLII